jgi:hypothetical protein
MRSIRQFSTRGNLYAAAFGFVFAASASSLATWGQLWPVHEARPAMIAAVCGPLFFVGMLLWWGRK